MKEISRFSTENLKAIEKTPMKEFYKKGLQLNLDGKNVVLKFSHKEVYHAKKCITMPDKFENYNSQLVKFYLANLSLLKAEIPEKKIKNGKKLLRHSFKQIKETAWDVADHEKSTAKGAGILCTKTLRQIDEGNLMGAIAAARAYSDLLDGTNIANKISKWYKNLRTVKITTSVKIDPDKEIRSLANQAIEELLRGYRARYI